MRTPLLAAAMIAVASFLLRAQAQPASSPPSIQPAPAESPEQAIQRDLASQERILTNPDPSSRLELREQAAERLVSRQRPDAREILLRVLRDSGSRAAQAAQVAVARALAGDPQPDPRFIEPLRALLSRDPTPTEAAASALATYSDNPEVLAALIDFARDTRQGVKSRVVVVKALKAFVKKDAAQFLIDLINKADEDAQVRDAAADSLVDMTGNRQFGRDVRQWTNWWAGSANQSAQVWEAAQIQKRAALYDQVQAEKERLILSIQRRLDRDYQRATDGQRTEMLLDWLKDKEPTFRKAGAERVLAEKNDLKIIPVPVIEQLRTMIGDSAVEVRRAVIIALREINDATSLEALLAQLAVETDADVKVSIAATLARFQKVSTVDALLHLLDDPSARVAEAAADALHDLGAAIRNDAALTFRVAAALRSKFDSINDRPGTEGLRASLLQALAQLHDGRQLKTFINALNAANPLNTARVRIAACRGLGSMIDPADREQAAAELVNVMLRDEDASVRLEAVRAMGDVATFAQAEALYNVIGPRSEERDADVRDAARAVLAAGPPPKGIFSRPEATANVLLRDWQDRFKKDPELRLTVLDAARFKLVPGANDPDIARLIAGVDQNMGEAAMELKQWGRALPSFRNAMDYWDSPPGQKAVPPELTQQLMTAYLRAGKYPEATQFASQRIRSVEQEGGTMGLLITEEMKRLMDGGKPGDLENARQLLDEATKMEPPLKGSYADQLGIYREKLKKPPV